MCMSVIKPKQIRVYLSGEDVALVDKLAGKSMKDSALLGVLCSAALDAIRNNQGRFNIPLTLEIVDAPHPPGVLRLNEPVKSKR